MSHKIKEQLDQKIGRKKIFTNQDKKGIYERIHQEKIQKLSQKQKKHSPLGVLLAYSIAIIILAISGFAFLDSHSHKTPVAEPKPTKVKQGASSDKQETAESPYYHDFESEKQYAEKYPNKFHIVKTMYFSLNHINNIEGEFEWGHPKDGGTERVHFYVDYDKKMDFATDDMFQDGKLIQSENRLIKNGEGITQLPEKHIFTKSHLNKTSENHYDAKSDQYEEKVKLDTGHSFVTNSEWVTFLLNNYKNWTYSVGNKFGIPVYYIKGVDHLERPFTMTVAKDTGALLELESYNKNDKKVDFYIKVKAIQINKGVPEGVFQLNLSGNKELSWKEFMPKTVEGSQPKKDSGGVLVIN